MSDYVLGVTRWSSAIDRYGALAVHSGARPHGWTPAFDPTAASIGELVETLRETGHIVEVDPDGPLVCVGCPYLRGDRS